MPIVRKKIIIAIAGGLAAFLGYAYFSGPVSKLTLLSRLHYNTLFVYTPCLSRLKTYDDGSVKFYYRRPPTALSDTAPLFISPTYNSAEQSQFSDAIEAIDLGIPACHYYSYKFKFPKRPKFSPPTRTINIKNGTAEVHKGDPSVKDYGPEFLYLYGKNGYVYRIELPFYLERMEDRNWLFAALYHSGVLSLLMPNSFTDYLPPRGFLKWFFTPCADKQLYYSGKAMLESLEISD